MIATQPENMTICQLEVLVMPNGEVIFLGKTVGWFEQLKDYLSIAALAQTDEASK